MKVSPAPLIPAALPCAPYKGRLSFWTFLHSRNLETACKSSLEAEARSLE